MQLETLRTIDSKDAPSLAPDDRPIDLVHLARTTLGDRSLEREVLQLFDRQSTLLIARMRTAASGRRRDARPHDEGLGARHRRLARRARRRSGRACRRRRTTRRRARAPCRGADEARAVIADLLQAN